MVVKGASVMTRLADFPSTADYEHHEHHWAILDTSLKKV
jgi:hypothetical protein